MDLRDLHGASRLDDTCPLPLDRPFTAQTARQEGVPPHQLTWLVKEGFVRKPIKGVYLATQAGDSTKLRAECLSLVVPTDAVICDRHAGWLLEAQMVLAPNEHLDLRPISVFRPSGHGRLRNGLADSGERNLSDDDVCEVHGQRVTTPLRTAWDLGRVRWSDQAISGLDAMHRLDGFPREEFLAGIERFRGMRWISTLRTIGPLADGRAESPGESVLRLRCLDCHLADMVPQVEIQRDGRLLAQLDLADEELRAAVEYDGAEWHSSPEQQEHDRARRADVRRTDWLVEAFTAANVFGRQRDVEERLIALRREARARRGLRTAS